MSDIAKSIRQLSRDSDSTRYFSTPGTVQSVDLPNRTIIVEPVDGTALLYDVRLQAVEGGNTGYLVVPKVGSSVVVSFINKTTGYLAQVSEVDHYQVEANGEDLKAILADFLDELLQTVWLTNMGPTTGMNPDNITHFQAIKSRLDTLFGT